MTHDVQPTTDEARGMTCGRACRAAKKYDIYASFEIWKTELKDI